MIYHFKINGIPVKSGDIICTTDGKPDLLPGEFWRLIGRLLPGDVDHIVIYTGPKGRFVEAGGRGVSTFELPGEYWASEHLLFERATLVDTFYGVVFPLKSLQLSTADELRMREDIVSYCLAQLGKPYNLNFLDPEREDAFYCSQLAYKAYQRHGINLNTGRSMTELLGSEKIVYPQEIWDGFYHRRGK
jgi:Permuted papain-like amidase enzyme, YaeF/YiiX, C92 family